MWIKVDYKIITFNMRLNKVKLWKFTFFFLSLIPVSSVMMWHNNYIFYYKCIYYKDKQKWAWSHNNYMLNWILECERVFEVE